MPDITVISRHIPPHTYRRRSSRFGKRPMQLDSDKRGQASQHWRDAALRHTHPTYCCRFRRKPQLDAACIDLRTLSPRNGWLAECLLCRSACSLCSHGFRHGDDNRSATVESCRVARMILDHLARQLASIIMVCLVIAGPESDAQLPVHDRVHQSSQTLRCSQILPPRFMLLQTAAL